LRKKPKTSDGEKNSSSTNVAGKLNICLQKTKSRSMFVPLSKSQLKLNMDLNIRPETLKLRKSMEYTESNRHRLGQGTNDHTMQGSKKTKLSQTLSPSKEMGN
jgi:hypothetical protein